MRESQGSNPDAVADEDKARAAAEQREPTVSKPGGFANDPADPSNPNEVIERSRRKLRP
jgi:hypothetical protein